MAEKKETAPTAEELAAKEKAETEPAAEAKAKKKAKPHEVELKDKDTGFYDQETGFKVVRDQRVPLGDNVGKATQMDIESGRLLLIKD
jgi:hypothetical protein